MRFPFRLRRSPAASRLRHTPARSRLRHTRARRIPAFPSGYGAPPPPPGYGQPPAGYAQYAGTGVPFFSAGDAFNWAWNKFTKNAAALIVPMLVYGVGLAVLGAALYSFLFAAVLASIFGGAETAVDTSSGYTDPSTASDGAAAAGAGIGMFGALMVTGLVTFIMLVAAFYVQAAFVSGSLEIADGKPVDIGSFLRLPRHFGRKRSPRC